MTSRVWSSSWSSLETSILATQRKLGRLIIDETPGLRPCTGCWTQQNTPRPLRGPLQRTCGPRTARGAALETGESRGAAGAQKNVCRCQSSPSPLRGALQSDCANGTNALGAENSPRYSVQDVEDSPKGRSAALSGELGGAERSAEPRGEVSQRRRCPHSVCGGRGAVGGSSTALPACGREHHPMYSTPGVRP